MLLIDRTQQPIRCNKVDQTKSGSVPSSTTMDRNETVLPQTDNLVTSPTNGCETSKNEKEHDDITTSQRKGQLDVPELRP
jgi:hypothetical protein